MPVLICAAANDTGYENKNLIFSPDSKDFYENQSGEKSADVRRVSHAACSGGREITGNNLISDPDSERDVSRNRREKIKNNRANTAFREKQKITAENTADCA